MRSIPSLLFALCLALPLHATTLYEQLCAFNPYWAQHAEQLQGRPAAIIRNDVDYVRTHLDHVLHVLSAAPTGQLEAAQRASRRELMGVLAGYAHQGEFPLNHHRRERTPVFIDEHGTFCAVGFLMRYTGEEAMARRIAAANNYAWVREITDPGLAVWQAASGFSLEELKLIQGAYDYYQENAFLLPDKYEVPQRPEAVVRYFDGTDKIWCMGEGVKGELHGRWVQHYSSTLPWIEGYFEHGKRSGRWKEYYKGTTKLCRTEHWRNNELNGVRTRYDREGRVIETILFKNGVATVKTNFDDVGGLRWVRTPIDSINVHTEVYTDEGGLIAFGNERIYNPEGLLWFQNIELTALNAFAIAARDGAPRPENGILLPRFQFDQATPQLPGQHTLVQYRKEGPWVYYKDYLDDTANAANVPTRQKHFTLGYKHFGQALYAHLARYDHLERTASYDSLHVVYTNDVPMDLYGFTADEQDHFQFTYYAALHPPIIRQRRSWAGTDQEAVQLKQITRLDVHGDLIGVREEYDRQGQLLRADHFYAPYKREEEVLGVVGR